MAELLPGPSADPVLPSGSKQAGIEGGAGSASSREGAPAGPPDKQPAAPEITDVQSSNGVAQAWQGYAIRVGILFTFVGLVIALGPVRDILGNAPAGGAESSAAIITWFERLRDGIGDVVSGLSLAFG